MAKVKSATRQLSAEQADTVRRALNILPQAEFPKPNIMKEMQDTLKCSKEDKSIMVLSADNKQISLIMDTDPYH